MIDGDSLGCLEGSTEGIVDGLPEESNSISLLDGGGSKATVTTGDTEGALVGSKIICCVSVEVTASLFTVDEVVVGFASAIVADSEGALVGFLVDVPGVSFAGNSGGNGVSGESVGVSDVDVVSVAGVMGGNDGCAETISPHVSMAVAARSNVAVTAGRRRFVALDGRCGDRIFVNSLFGIVRPSPSSE